MKRLVMLVMAILLITGCNAMQPNMEETELLWQETEKNIQRWAISTKAEASPTEKPRITPELTVEIPQKTPTSTESTEEPTPEPPTSPQTEQPEESPVMIDWPYPPITCPPEPEPTPGADWPYIVAPEPPTYTPEPVEPPQEQLAPTPVPVVPDAPVDPTLGPTEQPTEQPADPTPEPTIEPQTGYAECSCGTRLAPEEVLSHMKAHALNGESHSYRAY